MIGGIGIACCPIVHNVVCRPNNQKVIKMKKKGKGTKGGKPC